MDSFKTNLSNVAVFIGKNEENIKELSSEIMKFVGIPCHIERKLNFWHIYIDFEVDKDIVLLAGSLICMLKGYDKDEIKWVNVNGKPKSINKLVFLKLSFEDTKNECEYYVHSFKTILKHILNLPIQVEADFKDYYFYVKITNFIKPRFINDPYKMQKFFTNYNNFLKSVAMLVTTYQITNYSFCNVNPDIECYNFKEGLFYSKLKEENFEKMKEYFKNSSLVLGMSMPKGRNISKKILDIDKENSNISQRNYTLKEFSIKNIYINEHNEVIINSTASTYYDEHYTNSKTYFIMEDNLDITTKVEQVTDTTLLVISEIKGVRSVKNNKLNDTSTLCDLIYNCNECKDCEFTCTVSDYYELVDINLLLHYTDSSKYYETFEVPVGFNFCDGINFVKESKVLYDEFNKDWICYDDISKVKEKLISINK